MRRHLGWIFAAGIVLFGANAAFAQTDDRGRQIQEAVRKQNVPRPALDKYQSPALDAALTAPQKLYDFITAPETKYIDRCAAALRGYKMMPPEFIARIVPAVTQLQAEEAVHNWGLQHHPLDSHVSAPGFTATDIKRDREVLGRAWRVPDQQIAYPITFDEEAGAPWPWQVKKCLRDLQGWMSSQANEQGSGELQRRWAAACLALPVETEQQTEAFLRTCEQMQRQTVPVLSRWMAIALDPKRPATAQTASIDIADICRQWNDERSRKFGDIISARIIETSPHERARANAAISLRHLRKPGHGPATQAFEPPVLSIVACCEKAVTTTDSEWNRLTIYALPAAACMDNPPITADPSLRPDSSEAKEELAKFERWYSENGDALRREAAARRELLKPLIEQLDHPENASL